MPLKYDDVLKIKWSANDPSRQFPIDNPATGEIITKLQAGTAAEVDQAVQVAQKAFDNDWRWRSPAERSAYLFKCAEALEPHREELAELLCMENGKPKADAHSFDTSAMVNIFRLFASICDKIPGEFHQRGPVNQTVIYEPFGVCAGILPFNWPPIHFAGKTAPALAAGNVMIIKPGEQAPLTAIRIHEIISEVLPPNVVQIIPGFGPEVPSALVQHHLVKMVSFTGSTAAGAKVAETASKTITPVVLELGGKNALVVFDDVEDLEWAVKSALEGAFFNKGEACTASSRILVQKGVYKEFCDKMAAAVRKIRCGNGLDPQTHVGPQVSKAQQQKVWGYLEKAKELKATIAAQGLLPDDPACKNGYFVPPTLITDVSRDMIIAREEMFGNLVTVTPFDTEEEAISVVNESEYGLISSIFSSNNDRCWRFTKKVDVGLVLINNYFRNVVGVPFGGAKATGYGREHSVQTLREWSRAKVVTQPSGMGQIPSWRVVSEIFGEEAVKR